MKPYTFKLFLLLAVILQSSLFLSACDTTQPVRKDDVTELPEADISPETIHQATLTEEAGRLLELADDSDSPAIQHQYRVQATRLYLEAGRIALAKQQLSIIRQRQATAISDNEADTGSRDIDISLLAAEIAVAEKDVLLAKQLLEEFDSNIQSQPQKLSREQQIAYYALKADTDYLSGKYFFVVERRTQLAAYLPDDRAKQLNNRKIWAALSNMSDTQINTHSKQASKNATIKGWLSLTRVMRSGQQDIGKLEDMLLDWGTRYPSHPATDSFLTELIDSYQSDEIESRHIAVLLPMQGKLSQVIDTIKNGLLSAYYSDDSKIAKPTIKFYDTSNSDKTFKQLYEEAIADGATNIIGPFDKVVINQLLQQRELDVPVLTL
ncbi:MAG: penicillin-binding protein activator, partial [Proteobacteria bacterium]|nr:penicillin-binding protein activator [Pseudomonadota bacterium]